MQGVLVSVLASRWLWGVARLLLVVVFVASGLAKLVDPAAGLAEMAAVGLTPEMLFLVLTIVTLLGGSVLVLLDRLAWLAALLLGGFLALTIPIAHAFWAKSGEAAMLSLFFTLEHLSVIGGLLAYAIASQARRQLQAARRVVGGRA